MVMLIFQGTALSLTLRFSRYSTPLAFHTHKAVRSAALPACCSSPPDDLLAEKNPLGVDAGCNSHPVWKQRGITLSPGGAESEHQRMVCVLVCRTREGTQYLASVAVIWTELIKLLVCVGAQAAECTRTAAQRGLCFREEAMHQAYEILGRSWPMLIPAGLFVMQQARPVSFWARLIKHDPVLVA